MDSIFTAQKKLLPEMTELLPRRYRMLEMIRMEQPVGRRTLTELSDWKERDVRRETEIFRDQGLIRMDTGGMVLTIEGETVLSELKDFVDELTGISRLEKDLKAALGIEKIIVVPNDSDTQDTVKALIGRAAAELLEDFFGRFETIAVTGGSTVAAISAELSPNRTQRPLQFLAARGGLGGNAGHEANSIASAFAEKAGGTARTLYVPDQLSAESFDTLMKEPMIQEMVGLYGKTELVVHGIGNALDMAKQRNASPDELQLLEAGRAVSEAFGYYFDKDGKVVYRLRTAGIQMEQVETAAALLAVAGGKSKAEAIVSYFKNAPKHTVLVTDEGAAKEILTLTKHEEEL